MSCRGAELPHYLRGMLLLCACDAVNKAGPWAHAIGHGIVETRAFDFHFIIFAYLRVGSAVKMSMAPHAVGPYFLCKCLEQQILSDVVHKRFAIYERAFAEGQDAVCCVHFGLGI